MNYKKSSGILLHLTSLPAEYGIGDLGPQAKKFIEILKKAGQSLWQILPINPPGYGYSPYQCFSAFAGNEMLISIDWLITNGFLSESEVKERPLFSKQKVEFQKVSEFKENLYQKAFYNSKKVLKKQRGEYDKFQENNQTWLEDYALFMSLKRYFKGLPWNKWEPSIAFRKKEAVEKYQNLLRQEVEYYKFLQYLFFKQWEELKNYAGIMGIKIIGDIPIYVSFDSSDVWANPHLFKLTAKGNPSRVAGVPPDYFSVTGQLWGNPIYKWDEMAKDDFKWWRERFKLLLDLVDFIRLDHFRGFESFWEVAGEEKTAVNGRWVKGPGELFFDTLTNYLGQLPIIAEDLGVITPEVTNLRKKFNYPGMRVLHFEFEGRIDLEAFPYINHQNTVVYTGTHDNDTTLGWYKKEERIQKFFQKYFNYQLREDEKNICWYLIEYALKSRADLVIIPLQDVLCLDSQARMNEPGTVLGNWEWRFQEEEITEEIIEKLKKYTSINNRNFL